MSDAEKTNIIRTLFICVILFYFVQERNLTNATIAARPSVNLRIL